MNRLRRRVLPVVVAVVCTVVVYGVGIEAAPVGAATTTSCATVTGKVTVALVVDPGTPGAARVDCVTLPAGSKGTDALAARAAQQGLPAPRYENSGLLCAIDGAPAAPACGTSTGAGGYAYWSYWTARSESSWTYASQGPATRTLHDGDLEGWHFIIGTGTGNDFQPSIPPSGVSFAPAMSRTTTTTPVAPVATVAGESARPPIAGATTIPPPPGATAAGRKPATAASQIVASPSPGQPAVAVATTPAVPSPSTTAPSSLADRTDAIPADPTGLPTTRPTTNRSARIEAATVAIAPPESGGTSGVLLGLGGFGLAASAAVVVVNRRRRASS